MSSDTSSEYILLMEDEELVSTIAMQMLEFMGYKSVLAVDGGEALELYQERYNAGAPFNGVIMDLNIPGGMGGKQTVKELLQIDSTAKVIVSSGHSDDPAMVNYDEFGFCAAISKPFNMQDLTNALQVLKPV